jgi:cell division protein FtsB
MPSAFDDLRMLGWALPAIWRRLLVALGVALTVWMVFYAVYSPNGWIAYRQKRAAYQHLSQEHQQLEKENEELRHRIKELKTDPRAIEKIAREEFGLVRPGEYVYRLPPSQPAASITPPNQLSAPPSTLTDSKSRSVLIILWLLLAGVLMTVLIPALFRLGRKLNPTSARGAR